MSPGSTRRQSHGWSAKNGIKCNSADHLATCWPNNQPALLTTWPPGGPPDHLTLTLTTWHWHWPPDTDTDHLAIWATSCHLSAHVWEVCPAVAACVTSLHICNWHGTMCFSPPAPFLYLLSLSKCHGTRRFLPLRGSRKKTQGWRPPPPSARSRSDRTFFLE